MESLKSSKIKKVSTVIIAAFAMSCLCCTLPYAHPETSRQSDKVILFLPNAYEYTYVDGHTYLQATRKGGHGSTRDVGPENPIPISLKNGEQELTLGVRNLNTGTIKGVSLMLYFPKELKVTRFEWWSQFAENIYKFKLGNVGRGGGELIARPIYFRGADVGRFEVSYSILWHNFESSTGSIVFEVRQ